MSHVDIIPDEIIINKIYLVRGQKVMLDKDLAILYGVATRDLNKAVKRNITRFPEDFMFQLEKEEYQHLMFQLGTSSKHQWGGTRKLPFAFTEQGVAMLSSVLHSHRAVQVNIHIIRIFTKLRQILLSHKDILLKLEQLENQVVQSSSDIQMIFTALKKLLQEPEKPRSEVGFKTSLR